MPLPLTTNREKPSWMISPHSKLNLLRRPNTGLTWNTPKKPSRPKLSRTYHLHHNKPHLTWFSWATALLTSMTWPWRVASEHSLRDRSMLSRVKLSHSGLRDKEPPPEWVTNTQLRLLVLAIQSSSLSMCTHLPPTSIKPLTPEPSRSPLVPRLPWLSRPPPKLPPHLPWLSKSCSSKKKPLFTTSGSLSKRMPNSSVPCNSLLSLPPLLPPLLPSLFSDWIDKKAKIKFNILTNLKKHVFFISFNL